MGRMLVLTGLMVCAALLLAPEVASAQMGPDPHGGPPCMYRGMPYGHYCPGRGRGPYGARKPVTSADEAKTLVESYFAGLHENVAVGKIEEKTLFFEVELLNSDGTLIDKAIVDKRTGRIRSIY
jgi:hypothetical protein